MAQVFAVHSQREGTRVLCPPLQAHSIIAFLAGKNALHIHFSQGNEHLLDALVLLRLSGDKSHRSHGDAGQMLKKKPSDTRRESSSFGAGGHLPAISLPKGGGAIRGLGEKFSANPMTGTGSLTVPIYTSPGRSGFGPQLSLSYGSGSGNGPFGLGWSTSLPEITRKTDKGLPQYDDAQESDTFILSGAEDLVPFLLESSSQWRRDVSSRTLYGQPYEVHRYLPRLEGLFSRIERWLNLSDPRDTFWRSISKDNITTWYGKTAESRISDPDDPTRIFSWLVCESYDDKGNVTLYRYKAENSEGVDLSQACERNRTDLIRSVQRYLKRVFYGNRTPYFPDLTTDAPVLPPIDWCFELVLDYGDHDASAPTPQETQPWACRADAFSTYRATFENRTYRLCRRALMFHHFPGEPSAGPDCLIRSTDFVHAQPATPPADPIRPFYSLLLSLTQTGYERQEDGNYLSRTMPPLEFEYTEAVIDETVRDIDPESLENLPCGLDDKNYRWVDLDGEGLSGILSEQGSGWFYKPNLSPANQNIEDGVPVTLPQFGPMELVTRRPAMASLGNGRQQLLDLSGDGRLDLVEFDGPTPGFFERNEHEGWEPFSTFPSLPVLDWQNPNLRFIDLTGDGHADLLISEDNVFWWHNSLAASGFGAAQRMTQAMDEEKGPKLVFADGTESIFLGDMSGDGLTDLLRIRNGEVCYWPNLGYGRFGAKVTMDQSPWFEAPDLFDGRRIRLADIDGSGTTDLIYFAGGSIHLYFNQSGNAWGKRRVLGQYPAVDSVSSAAALDLLGNGTACLVWSSALPGNARQPMRYVDLMGGQKPHLLVHATNNLGAETRVRYAPSTKFYVADKMAGTPWLTRLPFPVHVVERVETLDFINRNRFVVRYAYHHGYYDGVEREFRGFGRVDQWDTEELATLTTTGAFPSATNFDAASNVPPVWTKTWFHTGAFLGEAGISKHLESEYYSEGDPGHPLAGLTEAQLETMLLPDTMLPSTIMLPDGSRIAYDLSGEELREACRALRGSILRTEVYAEDGTGEADRPYSVWERNFTIEALQPQGPNPYAVFFAHPREAIEFHYERMLYKVSGGALVDPQAPPPGSKDAADPRVTHAITLAVDAFGNVLQSASVGYGRRYLDPALAPSDQTSQSTILCTYTEHTYTNAVLEDDSYRAPVSAETRNYELIQVQPEAAQADVTNLFRFEEILGKIQAASDGKHDIVYENINATGIQAGQPYRRLVSQARVLYRPDDMGTSAGDPNALLPLGTLESLALPGNTYKLAFTPGLLTLVYQRGGVALLSTPSTVMGSIGPDGGGYVDLDGDGQWWIPSERAYFHTDPNATSAQELTQAQQHFFLPRRFEDPFGNVDTVDYDDPHDLLVVRTTDALANTVASRNDYRVLKPVGMTDPNGNRTAVSFDALGLVVGTAVMGKTTENLGDSLGGFTADLPQGQIDGFYDADDPHTVAGPLLASASTRIVYDVARFYRTRTTFPNDPSQWEPAFAATLERETHVSDLTGDQQTKIQISVSYSDGFGREIQKKVQAEPGPALEGGPTVNPRWVGSGWTIFNNKGKPVRKYEPFFSQLAVKGHQFEFDVQVGVSPILGYDPMERVVATLHPDHTYEKTVFDPWHQDTWDVNDTVLQADPKADADVGDFFQRLPATDSLPTWYAQRSGGGLGASEQAAATKSAAHANTPTVSYFDTLGRMFLTVTDNGAAGKYSTRTVFDIQGNPLQVTDARGNAAMTTDFDLLKRPLHSKSDDAGERWTLQNVLGKPIRAWDSRGFQIRSLYDELHRPTHTFAQLSPTPELLAERMVYVDRPDSGWTLAQGQADNLRGKAYQSYDGAGVVTNRQYDFKGNLLGSSRQLAVDYTKQIDWSSLASLNDIGQIQTASAPLLESGTFSKSTTYDALNRPVTLTAPDNSIIRPSFNEANLLKQVSANVRGASEPTAFITNLDYNAKGQRILCEYANGARTIYTYDPLTFRVKELTTIRTSDGATLQDLSYTYDPVGNIVEADDSAQQTVYFKNAAVTPNTHYVYDAIYRLIRADGREHAGQTTDPQPQYDWNDALRAGLPQPGDSQAMRSYVEQYQYDAVGNILSVSHQTTGNNWTRQYQYATDSDRLLASSLHGDPSGGPYSAKYSLDTNGNVTAMPHLSEMGWDFKNQFQRADLGGGGIAYYVYDAAEIRVRKVTVKNGGTLIEQRIYLGSYEIFRRSDAAGNVSLERQTLHIMDDRQRAAMVETKTIDSGSPVASPVSLMRYQFDNQLGSAILELDASAAIISYEEYYPYGSTSYQAVNSAIEASAKRYRYTGKERDDETGLYYHGARYYASWLGRWASCDPAGLRDGINRYAYVRGNPIRFNDPSGTSSDGVYVTLDEAKARACLSPTTQAENAAHASLLSQHVLLKDHKESPIQGAPLSQAGGSSAAGTGGVHKPPEDVQKMIDAARTPPGRVPLGAGQDQSPAPQQKQTAQDVVTTTTKSATPPAENTSSSGKTASSPWSVSVSGSTSLQQFSGMDKLSGLVVGTGTYTHTLKKFSDLFSLNLVGSAGVGAGYSEKMIPGQPSTGSLGAQLFATGGIGGKITFNKQWSLNILLGLYDATKGSYALPTPPPSTPTSPPKSPWSAVNDIAGVIGLSLQYKSLVITGNYMRGFESPLGGTPPPSGQTGPYDYGGVGVGLKF